MFNKCVRVCVRVWVRALRNKLKCTANSFSGQSIAYGSWQCTHIEPNFGAILKHHIIQLQQTISIPATEHQYMCVALWVWSNELHHITSFNVFLRFYRVCVWVFFSFVMEFAYTPILLVFASPLCRQNFDLQYHLSLKFHSIHLIGIDLLVVFSFDWVLNCNISIDLLTYIQKPHRSKEIEETNEEPSSKGTNDKMFAVATHAYYMDREALQLKKKNTQWTNWKIRENMIECLKMDSCVRVSAFYVVLFFSKGLFHFYWLSQLELNVPNSVGDDRNQIGWYAFWRERERERESRRKKVTAPVWLIQSKIDLQKDKRKPFELHFEVLPKMLRMKPRQNETVL